MSFDEFLDWRAFDLICPYGDRRADYHAASICAAIYNTTLMQGGSRKRLSPTEFLLEFKDVEKKDPEAAPAAAWQHMKSIARMHFAISKAHDNKPQRPKRERPARPPRPPKPERPQKRAR